MWLAAQVKLYASLVEACVSYQLTFRLLLLFPLTPPTSSGMPLVETRDAFLVQLFDSCHNCTFEETRATSHWFVLASEQRVKQGRCIWESCFQP